MYRLIAVVSAALGYVLDGLGTHTNTWLSPHALGLLSLLFLCLHLTRTRL